MQRMTENKMIKSEKIKRKKRFVGVIDSHSFCSDIN